MPRHPALALLLGLALGLPSAYAAEDAARPIPLREVTLAEPLVVLEPWLAHDDWSLRSLAALDLQDRVMRGSVALASRTLATTRHPYADALLLQGLLGRPRAELVEEGGPRLVEALLKRWDDAHPTVRAHARTILATLPTMTMPEEATAYTRWWQRARHAYAVEQHRLRAAHNIAAKAREIAPRETGTHTVPTGGLDERFYEYLERVRRDGLELCIVMDHTGSMASVIGAAKSKSRSLVERLRPYVPAFRAGLVTYDDGPWLRLPLSTNPEALAKAFRRVGAGGGGDYEEGVDKGIAMALKQEKLGWSRKAQRVLVVVGDAPPHTADLSSLMRRITRTRMDPLFDHPVIVHTVSTVSGGIPEFATIARAGGGQHVRLRSAGALVEELLALTFGGIDRPRLRRWMTAINALRKAEAEPVRTKR